MTNEGQAIIIFIDNSETSINGDFYPNRLDAQKTAAERLIQFFTRVNPQTQIFDEKVNNSFMLVHKQEEIFHDRLVD